jgi:amidohydrolase
LIDFLVEAEKIKDEIIKIRRELHMHPELGYQEIRTSKLIKDYLEKLGIEHYSVAKTGVLGIIRGKSQNGRTIGVRADIDALPIVDKKKCSYSSKEQGRMHACGHDAHTAILLGVAKILNDNKQLFSGNIKLLFEPAEETLGGTKLMLEEGISKNPEIDAFIGLHVTENVDCGMVKIKEGIVNAASNPFVIKVRGRGGHCAYPHIAIDPIVISAYIITAIQEIVSREISPVNPSVITIGSIHGGSCQNVIPDKVEITGTIRTVTNEDRAFIVKRVKDIVRSISKAFRGEAQIVIEEGYPCLYNDKEMTDIAIRTAKAIIGQENIIEQSAVSMGVESFAYFANQKPSVFYSLGTANKAKKTDMPAHGSFFDIDEDSIPIGIALQCSIILNYLTMD